MKKNVLMFFGATTISVVTVFIFWAAPQVRAYAASPVSSDTSSGSYDIGNSFQNLFSSFTGFIKNLSWNNNTSINTAGTASTWPTVNLTPVVEGSVQNILSQWLSEFDNWFYRLTGVQLSGIFVVLLNLISWTLGLAQQVVNWLIGLFH